jgi:CDGSH-type Zn-finger protein
VSITIRLKRNGPYMISVDQATEITIVDADGNILVPEPGRSVALCRCGGSSTKPFCDGTHRRNGFVGTSEPAASPAATHPDPSRNDAGPPGRELK